MTNDLIELSESPAVRAMIADSLNREREGIAVGRIILASAVKYGPGSRWIALRARPVCLALMLRYGVDTPADCW